MRTSFLLFGRFQKPTRPAITALSRDLGDPFGGESLVITAAGGGLTGATAVKFGTTNATSFVVDSDTQITAFAPAHAAGLVNVTVITPTTAIVGAIYEFWDPSVLTPAWFGDKTLANGVTPGYARGATYGTWTARSHTTSALSRDRVIATAPTVVAESPLFHRSNTEKLGADVASMTILQAWGTGDCTVLAVLDIVSIEVQGVHGGADDASNGCVVGNDQGYGSLLLGGSSANKAIFHYHSGSNKTADLVLNATTGRTVLAAKKVDISAGSADMRITQDGSTWVTGSTGVGALTGGSFGEMVLGFTGYLPYYYDGTQKVIVLDNKAWSDADVVKFYKWASGRHTFSLSADLGDTLGGESVVITGVGFTGATAVKFGSTNAASYVVDSDTQITAVAPAHAAGSVGITVVTPGGTIGILVYEFWDPTVPGSATSFLESPDYAPGTWTARLGPNFAEATFYPDNSPTGTPDFIKANNDFLYTSTQTVTFIGSTSHTAGCTFALVVDLTSLPTAGNYYYLWSDWNGTGAYTGVLIDDTGTAYMSFYDGSFASATQGGMVVGRNVLVGRKVPNGANSLAYMQVNGVQGSSVARGDLTVAGGGVYLGQNPYSGGLYDFDGKMKAAVVAATNWSDVDVAKFHKWATARHP